MATEAGKKADPRGVPYLQLLHEAESLLKNLDTMAPPELEAALERRQKLVDTLQQFDGMEPEGGEGEAKEFRAFRERTLRRVLEIDGLVIALARNQQEAIREQLSLRARSKSAVHSYESSPHGGGVGSRKQST